MRSATKGRTAGGAGGSSRADLRRLARHAPRSLQSSPAASGSRRRGSRSASSPMRGSQGKAQIAPRTRERYDGDSPRSPQAAPRARPPRGRDGRRRARPDRRHGAGCVGGDGAEGGARCGRRPLPRCQARRNRAQPSAPARAGRAANGRAAGDANARPRGNRFAPRGVAPALPSAPRHGRLHGPAPRRAAGAYLARRRLRDRLREGAEAAGARRATGQAEDAAGRARGRAHAGSRGRPPRAPASVVALSGRRLRVRINDGRSAHYRNVSRRGLDEAAEAAGVGGEPSLRLHDLRHTFASMVIAEGMDVVFVSRQLGHASPKITLDTYAHLFDRAAHADRARKALEAGFGKVLESTGGDRRESAAPRRGGRCRQFAAMKERRASVGHAATNLIRRTSVSNPGSPTSAYLCVVCARVLRAESAARTAS